MVDSQTIQKQWDMHNTVDGNKNDWSGDSRTLANLTMFERTHTKPEGMKFINRDS